MRKPGLRAVLAASPDASHGAVVSALDRLRAAGVRRYAIESPSR